MHRANVCPMNNSPDFCTGSCPLPVSRTGTIREQQLKRAKLLVILMNAIIIIVPDLPYNLNPHESHVIVDLDLEVRKLHATCA